MKNRSLVSWVLRIAVAAAFIGNGIFAVQGKSQWIAWVQSFANVDIGMAIQLVFLIGIMDIALGIIILLSPIRMVLLWATFWGFWTALIQPIMGEPLWNFIERWANWGAPLALLLMAGLPKHPKDWWKS